MREKTSTIAASKRVGEVLLSANLLKPEQYEAAMKEIEGTPDRVEDAAIALGFAAEADILKALAAHFKTNFVSSDRLSRAEIARSTLEMVPRRVAETFGVFPVMFDAKSQVLSVVTADPDDATLLNEIRQVSGAKDVKAFLSRPAAVRAAIAKSYGGDIHAFAMLDRAAQQRFHAMLDVYDRGTMGEASVAEALVREEGRSRTVTERDLSRTAENKLAKDSVSNESMLELCNVMVSLLENGRAELRGHSSLVARIVRRVVERINLGPAAVSACVAAAYLHDVGKMGTFHLTALNASEYDGHKSAAQKAHATPTRLLEGVHLPPDTVSAVLHMYERYDGKGFPESLAGKEIPLGARVLAIADTYADLTENPRNPYRKQLSPKEACEVLVKYKSTIFDPHLVDLFKAAVVGDDVRARLIGDRYVALLVDPDPEETTVLELRMFEQGFDVKTARSPEAGLKVLSGTDVDMVVSELDFPQGDGLQFLAEARKLPKGKDVPWVIHARRQAKADAQRAFELGVLDYVAKPAPTDVFVAKLKAIIEQRAMQRTARGVSGSLREMGLPDIIQILYHGRKTGKLRIRSGSEQGEIHVDAGAVVNALLGDLRGADAFYAMLKLLDGDFALDPQFKPQVRVIEQSSEALLLEGMRRMDEGIS